MHIQGAAARYVCEVAGGIGVHKKSRVVYLDKLVRV